MKICVFAPHPDDEVFGCGGSILKWLDEGHQLSIIYVTDNRAWYAWGKKENQIIDACAKRYSHFSEDKLGHIGIQEAITVAKQFGFQNDNVHLFKFHDQGALKRIDDGVKLAKPIIKDAQRLVIPSDNNKHPDHQATHTIAKRAALELNLRAVEFYVYAIYNIVKLPLDKQVKVKMVKYREKLYELMNNYKTQLCLRDTYAGWETLKRRRMERFGVFFLNDANQFYNF
jgi:LmbE family N-acetylglucosaminyl deacetylase